MKRPNTLGPRRWTLLAALVILVSAVACNRSEPPRAVDTAAPEATSAADDPRSNAAISTAVQAKFYTDDVVRARHIDVSAQDGVVTLRGTVQSDAEKQKALTLARSVDGVSSVNDQLQVRDTALSRTQPPEAETPPATGTAGRTTDTAQPAWITTKIQAQYFTEADIKPWNIDVTTSSGGIVTLEGTVETAEAKSEAVRIARETEGVTRVEDRLRVDANARRAGDTAAAPETTIERPDPWLTAKIQAKYFVDDEVKGRNIDVDTREGVVTLTGVVANEAERRQAVAIARNTDGVKNVTDQLRVDASMERSERTGERPATGAERGPAERVGEPAMTVDRMDQPDGWITTKIQAKYFLDGDVKGHQIDVDTSKGVVTLKGRVDTAQQKQEAEQIARETDGVTRVDNQLSVAGSKPGM